MSLRLEIISRHRQSLGGSATKEFGPDGGTIGRSLNADWALPDAQRFLSSRHASIDFHSGSYYIVDTSTNGVFINDSADPVGKGKPQRLFSGDVVRIGEYEMRVQIDVTESTVETLYDHDHVDPVDARQRVEAPDPTGHDLIGEFEMTGVGIEVLLEEDEADTLTPLAYSFKTEELSLEEDQNPSAAQAAAKPDNAAHSAPLEKRPAPAKPAAPAAQKKPSKPQARKAAKPARSSGPASTNSRQTATADRKPPTGKKQPGATDSGPRPSEGEETITRLITAFCDGAGVEPPIFRDENAEAVFKRLGTAFATVLNGLSQSLRLRTLEKAELGQAETVVGQTADDPLRLASNPAESIFRLLAPEANESPDAIKALASAFDDLNAHQRAAQKVMPKVLSLYLEQLDPDELEEKFSGASRNRIMGAANKLKYWDLYRDIYLVLSQEIEDGLPGRFAQMLNAAYAEEIAASTAAGEAASLARKVS